MAKFKVILEKRISPARYGMPEPNPFLASLPAPGKGATHGRHEKKREECNYDWTRQTIDQ